MSASKRRRGNEITINTVEVLTERNQELHHTVEYECSLFHVVRRAAVVLVQVDLSRPLSGDAVCVELHRGHRTSYRRGTRFTATLGQSPALSHQLALEILESEGSVLTLSLNLPADFPVGRYRMTTEVVPEGSRHGEKKDGDKDIVVIFNPWGKGDTVEVTAESEREEFVLNESGIIWAGAHNDMFTWPWNFAQFEEVSMEVALYLLDMHRNMESDDRKDPVKVVRAITEMVNMEDGDGGILYGLWSANEEDYEDGTDPTAWSGSSAILEEFWETKKAVRYGQCWVFGGLLTTVLRTLGIPARPVTNFESAHDGDGNRALDRYWDLKDELVEEKSHDSIWNYHVWVEAWMKRPDLGPQYGGWQAVDATPQEISPHSKSYVVGPASVSAVKAGLSSDYDTDFVIAEVNADIKDYCEVEKGKFELAVTDTRRVGKTISTKAVGSSRRCDITDSYKFEEGSELERVALGVDSANRGSDVKLNVAFSKQPAIGEDFDVVVTAESSVKESRSVRVHVVLSAVSYTGATGSTAKKCQDTITLSEANMSGSYTVPVKATDYLSSLRDQALLSVTALAVVKETGQSLVSKVPCRLHRPDLTLTVDGKVVSDDESVELSGGGSYSVKAHFTNTLEKTLTNVVFLIEGARLTKPLKIPGRNTGKGKVVTVSFTISPTIPKRQFQHCKLIVTCQSKQLKGIMGTANITVTK